MTTQPKLIPGTASFLNLRCEETTGMVGEVYLRCLRQPVVALVLSERGTRVYAMCLGCADHNIRNRGCELVVTNDREFEARMLPDSGG